MQALDAKSTALVLIDLQKGILGRELAPYTGLQVLQRSTEFARRCRNAGVFVVLVNAGWSADFKDALRPPVDEPFQIPPGGLPYNFMELADGLKESGDFCVTKRQWGAFHGTELDLQLRRRGIRTVILGGIATNFGVESTARQAWEHGYAVVLAEDVTTSLSAEMHQFSIKKILPRIARITRAPEIDFEKG